MPVTEISAPFKQSGQVTLDANGDGVLFFTPSSAWQRWEVTSVVVKTNQAATATTVPVATLALNTVTASTMSDGNNYGQSWSGNQDTFSGTMDVGPCDNLSVLFSPPPGASAGQIASLSGVIASAVVTGTRYTRRA